MWSSAVYVLHYTVVVLSLSVSLVSVGWVISIVDVVLFGAQGGFSYAATASWVKGLLVAEAGAMQCKTSSPSKSVCHADATEPRWCRFIRQPRVSKAVDSSAHFNSVQTGGP